MACLGVLSSLPAVYGVYGSYDINLLHKHAHTLVPESKGSFISPPVDSWEDFCFVVRAHGTCTGYVQSTSLEPKSQHDYVRTLDAKDAVGE